MSRRILIRNARLLDARWDAPIPSGDVLIEDGVIREISHRPLTAGDGMVIDLGRRTLMPGLIDAHVHCVATSVDLGRNALLPHTQVALSAAQILKGMLDRGFTTVRDAGGADWSLAQAVETGLIAGPRLFISGRALSQTGGHGDFRGRQAGGGQGCLCCQSLGNIARICDGVDAVRAAARDELRKGAHQVKVMASGGVASPTDPIDGVQYSQDELRAVVDEARSANTYVMAHAYTGRAITRAVESGVRTIEHGNLIDADAARIVRERGAFVVPTLVTYDAIARRGAALGFPEASIAKLDDVRHAGLGAIDMLRSLGVKMGFGTDLLGDLHGEQNREFTLRAEVLPARDIIASATVVNAEILGAGGKLGVLEVGAHADLIGVSGDPLEDITVLSRPDETLALIMRGGRIIKNECSG